VGKRDSSGDLISDQRYGWAIGSADSGDWAGASGLLEQTLELTPDWAAAWFRLGVAREELGENVAAIAAFQNALRLDPLDALGASPRLSLLGAISAASMLPRAYVTDLFDEYAPRFDAHLTRELGYRGPALIAAALDHVAGARRFARGLDLGCGTGLAGAALRARVDVLAGVDLSPAMIGMARQGGLYDALNVGEIVEYLDAQATPDFDLIVAADVLMYLGDLNAVFAAAARALAPDGLFAFSLEVFEGEGVKLGSTVRFAHARPHVEEAAAASGLAPRHMRNASVRREGGRDAPGMIWVVGHDVV